MTPWLMIQQISMEDHMGGEIAMLVRCNESPDEMLIAEGRALAPLDRGSTKRCHTAFQTRQQQRCSGDI
jgi:hypothetical protein